MFNNLGESVLSWTVLAFHQQSQKALIRTEAETCVFVFVCARAHACSSKMSRGLLNSPPGVYLIIL